MKEYLKFACKFITSGIIALVILSIFSFAYYNPPVAVAQPGKYTNFTHKPNTFWSCMTEGCGFGATNNLGYNSKEDVDSSEPLITVVGSSHMEAKEVPQDQNAVYQLQTLLFADSNDKNNIKCLNLGMGGHSFDISVSNFEYIADNFPNSQHVIIETSNLYFNETQLIKMYNGEYHSDLQERGTLYNLLQKVPYFRLLYMQYQNLNKENEQSSEKVAIDYVAYEEGMNTVMKKIAMISNEKGFKTAILYHSPVIVENGHGARKDDPKLLEIFKRCCEKNNITLIDVTDHFVEHFNETSQLPYGFMNTTLGRGHLNTVGHTIIAEDIYRYITRTMEEN